MGIYKITFVNNEISGCRKVDQRFDHDTEYYYEYHGRIVYAMIKADNEEIARNAAKKMIETAGRNDNLNQPPLTAAA